MKQELIEESQKLKKELQEKCDTYNLFEQQLEELEEEEEEMERKAKKKSKSFLIC